MDVCELCPRRCGVSQFVPGGERGWCGAGELPRVFRWGPHFGEEPPLVGTNGSGCVFFSRCTMKCLYCQNAPWSWQGAGEDKTLAELTAIFRALAVDDRCENWNLVSPTPYLPFIREAVAPLFKEGIRLPFVWNSSGYERTETLDEFSDLCDWALFDLRYSRDETAQAASRSPGYVAAARAAVKWAWNRGAEKTIVRILVLPGCAGEAVENLEWLAREVSKDVPISLMAQYTPAYRARETPPFDRRITRGEYEAVVEAASDLGFENGWTQGWEANEEGLSLHGENMPPNHGAVGKDG